jgi:hypothetical protein
MPPTLARDAACRHPRRCPPRPWARWPGRVHHRPQPPTQLQGWDKPEQPAPGREGAEGAGRGRSGPEAPTAVRSSSGPVDHSADRQHHPALLAAPTRRSARGDENAVGRRGKPRRGHPRFTGAALAAAAAAPAAPAAGGCRCGTAPAHRDRAEQLHRVVVPVRAARRLGGIGHGTADLEGRAALAAAEVVAGHGQSLRPTSAWRASERCVS